MSGFDTLGIWLTLQGKTKYKLVFNPNQTIPLFASDKRVGVDSGADPHREPCDLRYFLQYRRRGAVRRQDRPRHRPDGEHPLREHDSPGGHYFEFDLPGYPPLTFLAPSQPNDEIYDHTNP